MAINATVLTLDASIGSPESHQKANNFQNTGKTHEKWFRGIYSMMTCVSIVLWIFPLVIG